MAAYMIFTPGSTVPPRGPLGRDALTAEYKAGAIPHDAQVCVVGGEQWVPVREVLDAASTASAASTESTPKDSVSPPQFEVSADDGETVIGPVTLEQLRRGVEAGKVPRESMARGVGAVACLPVLEVIKKVDVETPVTVSPPSSLEPAKAMTGAVTTSPAMLRWIAAVVIVGAAGGLAWWRKSDLADPGYTRCVEREAAGYVLQAAEACGDAVRADATSKAGLAAKTKLIELAPRVAQARKVQAAQKEAEARAAQEAAKDREAAQASALAEAKRVVVGKYFGSRGRRDGSCTGKGLPPYRFEFEGGTYSQNALVATSARCVPLYPGSPISMNDFCCPEP